MGYENYDGLTYFSAAHEAGLLLHPVIGWAQHASLHGRELFYDPEISPRRQREQVLGLIAEWRAAEDGASAEDNLRELRARVLPVY